MLNTEVEYEEIMNILNYIVQIEADNLKINQS